MEKVRIGIVGVGWVAQVIHLPILRKLPEAEVVAICDKDKAKVRLVGEKLAGGLPKMSVGMLSVSAALMKLSVLRLTPALPAAVRMNLASGRAGVLSPCLSSALAGFCVAVIGSVPVCSDSA